MMRNKVKNSFIQEDFHMNYNNGERAFAFCHALLAIQLFSFVISVFSDHPVFLIGPITYCLTVFTTPLLVLGYGYRYMNSTDNWILEGIPFVIETVLAVLFVGGMIYNIRLDNASSHLFSILTIAYVVDVLICALGYLVYLRRIKASASSVSLC